MVKISTFVFMDMETTGIKPSKCNTEEIRITELSLIAVKREHLLDTEEGSLPRVQNKITLCFNPSIDIEPGCIRTSGLTKTLLENERPFKNRSYYLINGFFKMLQPPVCLVAQNGFRWDLPILQRNLKTNRLIDDLLCTDSVFAFYDITEDMTFSTEEYTDEDEEETSDCDAESRDANKTDKETNVTDEETNVDIKTLNETTPKKLTISENKMPRKPEEECFYSRVKNQFPWGRDRPKHSYKLGNIYQRMFDKSPSVELHRAENDAVVLLQCVLAIKEEFVIWADGHHSKFSAIPAMSDDVRRIN